MSIFSEINVRRPKRNSFDLSHDLKVSSNMGDLVPVNCMECVPGDRFKLSTEVLVRLAPLVSPIMHRVDVSLHWFFVPNRIVWKDWEKFITNTKDEGTGLLPAFPYVNFGSQSAAQMKLGFYLGLPDPSLNGTKEKDEKVSAIPFAAYQKIYNDYYRDQNLIDDIKPDLVNGDNTPSFISKFGILRKRAWEHDYFTGALPFAQKGDPVQLPLNTFDDVEVVRYQAAAGTSASWNNLAPLNGTTSVPNGPGVTNPDKLDGSLYAKTSDLANTAATINDLRRATKLQEWLERAARGGSRYIENTLAHFGVRSSDKRLNRPEYIVGTKAPVTISEVVSTAETKTGTQTVPQANMAGHGVSAQFGRDGSYYCEEHGYIMCMMSVMPKTSYFQGVPKHFMKIVDPFQFYWPSFANIGEQEVYNNELYAFKNTGGNTFGYVPRYAEYKYLPGRVAGDFRSSLSFWHMGRRFDSVPNLNKAFVEADPTTRVFAVTDTAVDHIWSHIYFNIVASRLMPKFGTPLL
nr:MAG: major capsid protein [Microvirus sp.]